eukprot:3677832-Amphidinium_carterae.1
MRLAYACISASRPSTCSEPLQLASHTLNSSVEVDFRALVCASSSVLSLGDACQSRSSHAQHSLWDVNALHAAKQWCC